MTQALPLPKLTPGFISHDKKLFFTEDKYSCLVLDLIVGPTIIPVFREIKNVDYKHATDILGDILALMKFFAEELAGFIPGVGEFISLFFDSLELEELLKKLEKDIENNQ